MSFSIIYLLRLKELDSDFIIFKYCALYSLVRKVYKEIFHRFYCEVSGTIIILTLIHKIQLLAEEERFSEKKLDAEVTLRPEPGFDWIKLLLAISVVILIFLITVGLIL